MCEWLNVTVNNELITQFLKCIARGLCNREKAHKLLSVCHELHAVLAQLFPPHKINVAVKKKPW